MLTFVLVTDEPGYQDAQEVLASAVKIIDVPDALFIAESIDRYVRVIPFKRKGDNFEEKAATRDYPPLQGECVFIQSANYNLIGDVFLYRLFTESKPQAGHRFRLLKLCHTECSDIDFKIVNEKFSVS